MEASAHLVVGVGPRGRSVVERLSCEVPLLFRQATDDDPGVTLVWVNGAGGPLGGDRLRLRVEVRDGASLRMVSSGASIAQPGPRGGHSALDVDVVLGDGSHLHWEPEPQISVRGSDHRAVLRVVAAPSAQAHVVERARWGRAGEDGGRLALRQRLEVGGAVVLDHELVLGGGALAGPGANGPGRAMQSVLLLGCPGVGAGAREAGSRAGPGGARVGEAGAGAGEVKVRSVVRPDLVAAVLPLGHGAVLATAGGDDFDELAAALDPLLAPPAAAEPSTNSWC